jgi:RNA polymerase primary sigma factor
VVVRTDERAQRLDGVIGHDGIRREQKPEDHPEFRSEHDPITCSAADSGEKLPAVTSLSPIPQRGLTGRLWYVGKFTFRRLERFCFRGTYVSAPGRVRQPLTRSKASAEGPSPLMLPSYFHEIGKIPLLTAEEEVDLSRRVQAGCEQARNRMIAANLRLVVRIAGEFGNFGLPMADLVSEGNLGLIKAVQKFLPQKGGKFSSYASWWIRQAIHRALAEQSHAIRLTPLAMSKVAKLRRVAHGMAGVMGREPTDDELAGELGMDASSVRRLKNISARPASMDAVVSEDGGTTLGSLLADESAEDPLEVLSGKDLGIEAGELLALLRPRERAVIVRRFGLEGERVMTLDEIGSELGCTRERVRQIQDEALKRMRRAFGRRRARQFLQVASAAPRHAPSPPARFKCVPRSSAD